MNVIITFWTVCFAIFGSNDFYPRDAMLARVFAMAQCLVRLSVSVCHKSVFYQKEWTDYSTFWREDFFRPVLHCIYKNKGTFLWNFFLNFGLRKFRHGISIVERAINLARESSSVSERDKPDSHWSTKLIIPPSSDARPLYSLSLYSLAHLWPLRTCAI